MITNAGMKVLRKETLEKFGDSYQERLDKTLFYYDVDALKTVFYTLSEFQKEGR